MKQPPLHAPPGHKEELRRQRLEEIQRLVADKGSITGLELRNKLMLMWGLTQRTASEYIHALIYAGRLRQEEGMIYPVTQGVTNATQG